jgi:hypothetical protein
MSPFQSLLSACTISLSLAVFAAPVVSAQTPLVPFNSMPNILQDYIYGYAPVAMAATRALMTAVPNTTTFPGAAPVNQFGRVKTLAGPFGASDSAPKCGYTLHARMARSHTRADRPACPGHRRPLLPDPCL